MIQQMLIKSVLKILAKKFKLDKVLKYVENENELDIAVRNLKLENHEFRIRIEKLEEK